MLLVISEKEAKQHAVQRRLSLGVEETMGWFGQKKSGKNSPQKTLEQPLSSEARESSVFHNEGGMYVAPDPVITTEGTDQPPSIIEHPAIEDGEMIVISKSRDHDHVYSPREADHGANSTFSKVDDTATQDHNPYSNSKQSHLNSLFNGHLMKWKFEAEEGSVFIRIPACKLQ